MPVPSKIFSELLPEDLAALEEFARDRRNTSEKCHEWLQAHGYTMSQSSVDRWKRKFDMTDKFRAASGLAGELMTMKANAAGSVDVADAANLKLHQLLFEKLLAVEGSDDVATKDLLGLAMALRSGAATKKDVEELKEKQRDAVAQAEKAVANGASGEQVVNAIKKAMGI